MDEEEPFPNARNATEMELSATTVFQRVISCVPKRTHHLLATVVYCFLVFSYAGLKAYYQLTAAEPTYRRPGGSVDPSRLPWLRNWVQWSTCCTT